MPDSTEWPKPVTTYETSDGEFHRTLSAARYHQQRIDGAHLATQMLDDGKSLGEALRAGGLLPDGIYPALDEVYQSTKLIISHWQCRDQPGYSPIRVDKNGDIFVYGNAGSWSGPYGCACSAVDVERYWQTTKATTNPGKAVE